MYCVKYKGVYCAKQIHYGVNVTVYARFSDLSGHIGMVVVVVHLFLAKKAFVKIKESTTIGDVKDGLSENINTCFDKMWISCRGILF